MVLDPSKPFRRNRTHNVQPPRVPSLGGQQAAKNSARGERIPGQIDDPIVKIMPGVIQGFHVHGLVVVQEVERERQHAVFALIIQIERRGPAERREQRVGGERARRQVQKPLGQFKGLRPFVGIESHDEVGLYVRYVLENQIDVFGYLTNFVHALQRARFGLAAQFEPRLDSGQDGLESIALETLQVRFREQRQTAFGGEIDTARRHGVLDHIQVVVESDAEIGIVPGYQRLLELRQQEPQILAKNVEIHGLIGHHRIDAKTASIRTPQAAKHGNHLDEWRLLESRFDELPALAYPWKRPRLLFGAQLHTVRPMLR